jgi:hypothetical protein
MRIRGAALVALMVLASVLLDGLSLSWDPVTDHGNLIRAIIVFSLLLSQANVVVVWAVLGNRPAPAWRLVGLLVGFAAWIWALQIEWPDSTELQIGGHILLLPQIVVTGALLLVTRAAGFRVADVTTGTGSGGFPDGLRWWQFSLASLFACAAALAVVLGLPEGFPSVTPGPSSFTDLVDVSIELGVLLGGNAVITLLALWTVLGRGRNLWRMPVLVLAAAAVGVAVFRGDYVPLPSWFLPTVCLGHLLLLGGSLAVLGLGNYRLVWRPYRWRTAHD